MANLEKLNNTINELENQASTLQQFSGIFGKVNNLKDEVNESSKIIKKSGSDLNAFVKKANTDIDSTLSQIETRSNKAILSINVLQKENHNKTMEFLKTKLNELYDDNKRYQKDLDGLITSKLEQNKSDIKTEIRSRIRELESFTEKRIVQIKTDIQLSAEKSFAEQNKKLNLLTGLTISSLILIFTTLVLNFT